MGINEDFWKMFGQVLGYGATASFCLFLVLQFILKWQRTKKSDGDTRGENGNGKSGDKSPGWWTTEMSRITLATVQPILAKHTERIEELIKEHHDYVRDRHEQMTLALHQINQVQTGQIELLKELTQTVRAMNSKQNRFMDAIATLERFGRLHVPMREEDSER